MESFKEQGAFTAFERLFKERGLPQAIRSDNGVPFTSPKGLFNLSRLAVWWLRLGIAIERIQPGHPQQMSSERCVKDVSGLYIWAMAERVGFEPTAFWFVVGKAGNPKALQVWALAGRTRFKTPASVGLQVGTQMSARNAPKHLESTQPNDSTCSPSLDRKGWSVNFSRHAGAFPKR